VSSLYRTVELRRFVVVFGFAVSLGSVFPLATMSAETTGSNQEWAANHCATSAGLRGQEKAVCSAYAYQQADAKLNALYRKLKTLSDPEAWKLQVEEERAWVKERDDNCREEDGAKDEGSNDTNGCLALLTNQRVKFFEERIAAVSKQAGQTSQEQPTFAGGWTAWMCPPGAAHDPEHCASFEIFLYEKEGQLCGAHIFATANATRLDEGGAPSIIGKLNGPEADMIAQSGRSDPPVRMRVRMSLAKNGLHWKMVGMEPSQGGSGEYLIPEDVWLHSTFEHVFSEEFATELKTACEGPSPSLAH
jgi:uncharacterized protein YecT (DUF1311 family)